MAKSIIVKYSVCGQCSQSFVVKDYFNPRTSRCPINLQCGHSVCELCLRNYLQPTGMTCAVCQTVSVPKSGTPPGEEFNLNMYLLGHMLTSSKKRIDNIDKDMTSINFMPAGARMSYSSKKQEKSGSVELCGQCSKNGAVYRCDGCNANYCHHCCKKIHSTIVTLKNHVYVSLQKYKKTSNDNLMCRKHGKMLEFYCSECSAVICSNCIIESHQGQGHKSTTLKEKNFECLDLLNSSAEEARLRLLRLKQTLKKTNSEINNSGTDKSKHAVLEQKLARYFSHLHGLLQVVEETAMMEVAEARSVKERSLEKAKLELESNIENIQSLLNEVQESKEPNSLNSSDLSNLCARLAQVKDVPSFLVYPQTADAPEPTLELNEEIQAAIANCCKLIVPPESGFELHTEQKLPEDYKIDPLPQEDTFFHFGKQSASDRLAAAINNCESRPRTTSGTQFSSASSNGSLKSSYSELKPRIEIQENGSYSVFVCYVANPGKFYVNLSVDRERVKSMEKRTTKYLANENVTPDSATKDELYLVQYNLDEKWYRGRVKNIVEDGSKGEENILVYYVDYGNEEFVSLSKLRCISDKLREEPFLAHKCKLFDCVPKGDKWSPESTKTMISFLKKSLVTMYVMKINTDGSLDVDLCKTSNDENIGHEIYSFRDAMIFLEFANFVQGSKKSTTNSPTTNYINPLLPKDREEFAGTVSYSASPNEFFVQKLGTDIEYLIRMMKEMDRYYQANSDKSMIYNPVVGMPCAAQFSDDDRWYRATIINLPGKKKVTVFYVDYGNKETISYTRVRKLHSNFFKLVPQAIKCSLAYIKPKSNWDQEANKFFGRLVVQKRLRIHVDGRDKLKLRVVVYEISIEKEVCLNLVLVEHDFATATGPLVNKPSVVYKSDIKGKKTKISLKKLTNGQVAKAKKKLSAEELRARHISYAQDEAMDSDTEVADKSIEKPDDGILRVKVKVPVVQSPSVLYVQVLDYLPKLRQLQKELKEYYKNTTPDETIKWEVNDKCVVLNCEKEKWSRAIIHEIISDERVKVFLKDFAEMEEVPIANIRPLEEQFSKMPVAATKCHLSGVRPAEQDWPCVSCEFLASELEDCSHIYFTKAGTIENNSLPIELWVKKVTHGGALEPTKEEWVTLNQQLVDRGLAVPVKTPNFFIDSQSFDFLCDFNINKVDDSERRIWKTQKGMMRPESFDIDVSDAESDVTDPGSSVSAHGSNCSAPFIPSVVQNWEPAKRIGKKEFVGVPTFVDSDGVIYIYDKEADESTLTYIKNTLSSVYAHLKPIADDFFYSSGQLCIVRYHGDKCWYRGRVLNVKSDLTYDVLFVDYGNVENCQAADMRKSIKMLNIPILTHKFVLSGIASNSEDGQWPEKSIEIIHSLIVDNESRVFVEEESFDTNLPSKIHLQIKGTDLANHLVDLNLAFVDLNESEETGSATCTDRDVVIDDEIPEKTEKGGSILVESPEKTEIKEWSAMVEEEHKADLKLKKTAKCLKMETSKTEKPETEKKGKKVKVTEPQDLRFKNWKLPKDFNWIEVELVTINGPSDIAVTIVENDSLPASVRKMLKKFETLYSEIQDDALNQPILKSFKKDTSCISFYSDNNDWHRAVIEKHHPENDNLVQVYYVDYGNREYVDKKNIRACKEEWCNIPKHALRLKLFNMAKCSDVSKDACSKELTECMATKTLFINIVTRHETHLEVKIHSAIMGPLVYQRLIDENILKPEKLDDDDDDSDKEN